MDSGYRLPSISDVKHAICQVAPLGCVRLFQERAWAGQLLGLFPPSPAIVSSLNMNHAGVIPKGCKTEKCRLITNLSFAMKCQWWHHPRNLYTFIHLSWLCCSDSEPTGTWIFASQGGHRICLSTGTSSSRWLAPSSYTMWWTVFVDPMLPFSLCSAPKISNAIADRVLQQRGVVQILYYLDDYIIISPPESSVCQRNLTTILHAAGSLINTICN